MMYNTQTDKRWSKEVMTHPSDQESPDTLGRWGCLVTCLSIIIQEITEHEFTPKDMNDVMHKCRGYLYLDDPSVDSSIASAIHWKNFEDLYSDLLRVTNRVGIDYYSSTPDKHYIARVKHPYTGGSHYVYVVSRKLNNFWCFDVEDGKVKSYLNDEVQYLHEVRSLHV